jgi:beta-lactamase class A
MKLIVAMAVMDAVDRGQLHLQDSIVVRHEDLSLFVQITAGPHRAGRGRCSALYH